MVADFRAIYGLSWWEQVESGDIEDTECLVHALRLRPDSLWRATIHTRNPPPAGTARTMNWLGWDQQTALLLELRNMLAGRGRGLRPPPTARPTADADPDADDPAPAAPVVSGPLAHLMGLRVPH